MKVCRKCNLKFDDKYGFCRKCGQKLEIYQEENTQISHITSSNNQVSGSTSGNSNFNKRIMIAVAVIVLALLGFFVFGDNPLANKDDSRQTLNNSTQQHDYSQNNSSSVGVKPSVSVMAKRGGIIIGTDVFMRSGPGKQYKAIGVFKQGDTVEIIEGQQDWFKVRLLNQNNTVWVFKTYCAEYFGDRQMPDKIILYQAYPGEASVNILKCIVSPKRNLNIYEKADENSKIIDTLNVGNYYSILDYELHTYPRNNVFTTNYGTTVRLLSYRGEGYYSIFYNGIIQEVEMQTNQLVLKQEPDFWLCVKISGNKNGWVFVKEWKDFLTEVGSGIFLTKPKHMQG